MLTVDEIVTMCVDHAKNADAIGHKRCRMPVRVDRVDAVREKLGVKGYVTRVTDTSFRNLRMIILEWS